MVWPTPSAAGINHSPNLGVTEGLHFDLDGDDLFRVRLAHEALPVLGFFVGPIDAPGGSRRVGSGPVGIIAAASDQLEVVETGCRTNGPAVGAPDQFNAAATAGVLVFLQLGKADADIRIGNASGLPASRMKRSVLSMRFSFLP